MVLDRVEREATARLGRPVEIRGVRWGWTVPLSVERVALPPLADEPADAPLFALRDVRLESSLASLVGTPPIELGPIRVGSLEGTVVRFADGSTSVERVLAALAKSTSPAAPEPPPEPAPAAPPRIPLAGLDITVDAITARWIDQTGAPLADARAGLRNLRVQWQGAGTPLSVSADTHVALNRTERLGAFELALAGWTTKDGALDLANAEVTVTAQGDGSPAGSLLTARATLDPARLDFASSGTLPLADVFALAAEAMPTPLVADTPEPLRWSLALRGDATARFLHEARITANFPGFDAELRGESLATALDNPRQKLTALLNWSAAEFLEALRWEGKGIAESPLEGWLELRASLAPPATAGEIGLRATARWKGERLATLEPFSSTPLPILERGPVSLAATSFYADALVFANPATKEVRLSRATLATDWIEAVAGAEVALGGAFPVGTANVEATIPLAAARDAAVPFAQGPLPGVDGRLRTELSVRMRYAQPIEADLYLSLTDFLFAMDGRTLAEEDFSRLVMSTRTTLEPLAVAVPSMRFDADFGEATAEAGWSADAGTSGTLRVALDLAALPERIARAAPDAEPVALEGVARFEASGTMATDGSAEASAAIDLDEASVTARDITVALPLHADARLRKLAATRADEMAFALDESNLAFGDALAASATGAIGMAGTEFTVRLDASAAMPHAPLWEAVPEAIRTALPVQLLLDGETSVSLALAGAFRNTDAGPVSREPIDITLRTSSEMPAMEWAKDDLAGTLADVRLTSGVRAAVLPQSPADARAEVAAEATIGRVDGPMGVAVSGIDGGAFVTAQGSRAIELQPRLRIARIDAPLAEGSAQVQSLEAQASIDVQDTDRITVRDARLALGDHTEALADASASLSGGLWEARFQFLAESLRDLAAAVTMPNMPLIEEGSIVAQGTLSGRMDPRSSFAETKLPVTGRIMMEVGDLTATLPFGTIRDMDTATSVTLSARDAAFDARTHIGAIESDAFRTPVERVGARLAVAMDDLNQMRLMTGRFSVHSTGTEIRASGRATGFRDLANSVFEALAEGAAMPAFPATPEAVLAMLDIDGEATFRQDLALVENVVPDMSAQGTIESRATLRSRPGRALRAQVDSTLDITEFTHPMAVLRDFRGTPGMTKTVALALPAEAIPPAPEQVTRLANVAFEVPPLKGAIGDLVLRTRALDGGLEMTMEAGRFLGGTARFDGRLREISGHPVIEGTVQVTGLDARTLTPATSIATDPDREISGVGRLRWDLGGGTRGNPLQGLDVSLEATKLSRRALLEFLRALDASGTDPRIQSARTALQFGSATGGSMRMENGLLSMQVGVRPRVGPPATLNILRRVPIGEFQAVFPLAGLEEKVALTKHSLSLLLAEDINAAQRALNSIPGANP